MRDPCHFPASHSLVQLCPPQPLLSLPARAEHAQHLPGTRVCGALSTGEGGLARPAAVAGVGGEAGSIHTHSPMEAKAAL